MALDRLRNDRVAILCAGIVIFFILVAIFAPLLAKIEGQSPDALNMDLVGADTYPTVGPSSTHWLGIEPKLGRDNFARWAYGSRPSLIIGFVAATFSTIIGVTIGLIAGYLGGVVDRIISWFIDLMLSLPFLLLVLALVPIIQQRAGAGGFLSAEEKSTLRFWIILGVLVAFGWMGLARLIRGEVLSLREREFVQAAKVLGVPTRQILAREILPNLVGPIIVSASIAVPAYISSEAVLSFLGAGLVEPTASWGRTVFDAQRSYQKYPIYFWVPVISISLLVLALSLLGESIRDAFDPNARPPMRKAKNDKKDKTDAAAPAAAASVS